MASDEKFMTRKANEFRMRIEMELSKLAHEAASLNTLHGVDYFGDVTIEQIENFLALHKKK